MHLERICTTLGFAHKWRSVFGKLLIDNCEHSYYHREIRTIEWNHGAFGFEHAWYGGREIHFPAGRFDWGSFPNDFISSIKVDWCHELIVYEHTRFTGKARVWRGETNDPWIGDEWNDEISSVIVNRIC